MIDVSPISDLNLGSSYMPVHTSNLPLLSQITDFIPQIQDHTIHTCIGFNGSG